MPLDFTSIQALLPVLSLLNGYAVQNEEIKQVEWLDNEPVAIKFPAMEFRRVSMPRQASYAWILSDSHGPLAAFQSNV